MNSSQLSIEPRHLTIINIHQGHRQQKEEENFSSHPVAHH